MLDEKKEDRSSDPSTALYVPLSLVLEAETGGSLDLLYASLNPGSVRNT